MAIRTNRRSATVEVGGPAAPGESRIRRAFCSPDKLVEGPNDEIKTMADVLPYCAKTYGDKQALGWRKIIKIHTEKKDVTKTVGGKEITETKTWQYFELSGYEYISYNQLLEKVKTASNGLRALGLDSSTHFNIYAQTSVNWQVLAHACVRQNIVFCTAYDTLGEDGLTFSLNEPEVQGMFTNGALLPMLSKIAANTTHLKYVIYDGTDETGQVPKLQEILEPRGGRILTLDQLAELGKANPVEPNMPSPDSLACIMYTSGSTGTPKGVLLLHKNVVSSVGTVTMLLGPYFTPDDTLLAYLPLAHILEFVAECSLIFLGITLGYGMVKTLTNTSVRNCKGDLQEFRPTLLVGVPAVFETIRKGILAKVKASGAVKRNVFGCALKVKQSNVPALSGLADRVFNAVKSQTGGRLRFSLSGGAPLSRATQQFIASCLVLNVQGYGLTESSAMCAIATPEFNPVSSVGVISPAIEVKLVDVPDAGYKATNKPPQGEVWIRGPAVCAGYYKREDLTKETITEDGWLMTGDVGQFNKDGTLSLIDRKKNLVKLAGGEYIAIEALESVYKSNELVANICVVANTNANRPMGVVHPNEANLRTVLAQAHISGLDSTAELHTLCESPKVVELVSRSLAATGKQARFKPLQMLQTVLLVPDELNVTAAQKIERKKIEAKYKDAIAKVYP